MPAHKHIDEMVEDALWMFAAGETPDGVARRLGIQLRSLQKAFERAGKEFPFVYEAHQWRKK